MKHAIKETLVGLFCIAVGLLCIALFLSLWSPLAIKTCCFALGGPVDNPNINPLVRNIAMTVIGTFTLYFFACIACCVMSFTRWTGKEALQRINEWKKD